MLMGLGQMSRRARAVTRLLLALVAMIVIQAVAPTNARAAGALVLYDYRPNDSFGKLGKAYAIMLRNLLGHFNVTVDLLPIQNYTAGAIGTHDATFYLGSYFDNPVPAAFLSDVATAQKTVVWFKYNIWQLAWNSTYNFTANYGMTFDGLRGLNATPTAGAPTPGFFDTILYGGKSMAKYYSYDSATNTVAADPEVGQTSIVDATRAQMVAPVRNGVTGEQIPYVVRSGNFWYFADLPFSYIGPRDRYLVICDLLHDMLPAEPVAPHRAMIRLEDVGALVSLTAMQQLSNYMVSGNIPFSIATIPFYRDPLGVYNGGVAQEIHLRDAGAADLRASLNYARTRGGSIVMHGYTHQYASQPNPHNGVSGDDFEFWNIVANAPIPGQTTAAVLARLDAGRLELTRSGYTAYAWETPHYNASPTASRAFPLRFPTAYQRMVYYTSDAGSLANGEYGVGQFFPYIIRRDYYGQRILPENLGNIEYDISAIDPTSNIVYTAQDILTNADYARVVRGGFASFFFHPFWLEPAVGTPGLADFQTTIQGINALGYSWVSGVTAQ